MAQAKDVMMHPAPTLQPQQSLSDAWHKFRQHHLSGLPVVDKQKHLVGFISEQDLIKQTLEEAYYSNVNVCIGDVMKAFPDSISPERDLMALASEMAETHRRFYPVVDEGRLVGLVVRRKVVDYLMELAAKPSPV
ncbi:CBS domain-containing protein [Pelagibaculum spongiae]|uniref:CBS domain-containing protein n=1 Tax=Pelagibaculum spongiae TaxID=2080658 RepID=A0A2V1GTK4_9GAMM|nr:CBS domain-containing protein [Pelagibaculum spongiae]PVZ68344.1 hypothetical protein DC094_13750 [Pelagibaculum spongiae]